MAGEQRRVAPATYGAADVGENGAMVAARIFHIGCHTHNRPLVFAFTPLLGLLALFCTTTNGATHHQPWDFDGDGQPDFVLYNPNTFQTAIWYLNNTELKSGAPGPTLPPYWHVAAVADFDGDGHPDFALFDPITGQTAIWYLSGATYSSSTYGPSIPSDYALAGSADFNGDRKPD